MKLFRIPDFVESHPEFQAVISEDNFLGSFQAPFKALVEELDGLTVADLDPVGTIIIKTSPDAVKVPFLRIDTDSVLFTSNLA